MKKVYSIEQKEMMVEMYKAGMTKGMIERIFGVNSYAISKYLSQADVSPVEGINRKRSKELIEESIEQGLANNMDVAKLMLEIIDSIDLSKKVYGTKEQREIKRRKAEEVAIGAKNDGEER